MKKIFTILSLLLSTFFIQAQDLQPIKWSMSKEKINDKEFFIVFTANAEKPWVVYSQHTKGATPTIINYDEKTDIELVGANIESGHKKEAADKLFDNEVVIKYLSDEPFVIKQKIKITGPNPNIVGYIEYMTCDNTKCIGGLEADFSFSFNNGLTSNTTQPKPAKKAIANANKFNIVSDNSNNNEQKLLEPIKWTISNKKISDTEFDLIYTSNADKDWSIYSQFTDDNGPTPTSINYEVMKDVELVGKGKETGHKKEGPDKLFENNIVIKYLSDEPFVITQRVKITGPNPTLNGYIDYMTCDKTKCIGGLEHNFSFDLLGQNASTAITTNVVDGFKLLDQKRPVIIETLKTPAGDCGQIEEIQNKGLFMTFLLGFIGGLFALLTPCVFPMIPLTVSFFTKDTKRKGWVNGLIYGASIIVIYVALGLLITSFFGAEALNALSVSWIANTLFFVVFLLFAFSFFGYYEITLPSSWSNKSDKMADKGGLIGIFFMAATLAIVSFSCTGPIIGSALVQSATSKVGPLVVMLGFSSALALPFGLFAAFPSWLNSLPRSGGWMNSVKVVLGFLEVALAFKFLSIADMTMHWGILKYETFMIIWIAVFAATAAYLFGFIKFPHDSKGKLKLSPIRGFIGVVTVIWTIYLATGFIYNDTTKSYDSLSLMSGLAPPTSYNLFLDDIKVNDDIKATYASYTKCANNIDCFKDYFEGLEYSKKTNKPMLVDMTGYGCVNCRSTEENIWIDSEIRTKLNDDFVLVSLYVDDKKKLDEIFLSANIKGKKIRNIGGKWADFQIVNFAKNAQPLYIIVSPDEKIMASPRGYKPGIKEYNEFLDCGMDAFKKKG